jgi:hypothetical protein
MGDLRAAPPDVTKLDSAMRHPLSLQPVRLASNIDKSYPQANWISMCINAALHRQ